MMETPRIVVGLLLILIVAGACTRSRDLDLLLGDCGDGVVDGFEACDDNNRNNFDGCSSVCRLEVGFVCQIGPDGISVCVPECGDGERIQPEACDDNNTLSGDGCSANCVVETGWTCGVASPSRCDGQCGDAQLVGGEECDDGNAVGGDGCSTTCRLELGFQCAVEPLPSTCIAECGDGRRVTGEACDDGNDTEDDGCSEDCIIEEGWTCPGRVGEQSSCFECGNGRVEKGVEVCDDRNQVSGDGCSATCTPEPGWTCDNNQPSFCTALCGDSRVVDSERCDDGNQLDNDGCSETCQVEPGWLCDRPLNSPSRCLRQWVKRSVGVSPILSGSSSVQAGTEILFFGGGKEGEQVVANGVVYDLETSTWSSMSTTNAPGARTKHTAVWTGEEMIVFGGYGSGVTKTPLSDGACYNPTTDTWTALEVPETVGARAEHTAVWTGEEMIVFGGVGNSDPLAPRLLQDGYRYRPDAPPDDQWVPVNSPSNYSPRRGHVAVWTGDHMIVHGGATLDLDPNRSQRNLHETFRFEPEDDKWMLLEDPLLQERHGHGVVWTGEEMIFFGGYTLEDDGIVEVAISGGSRFDPGTGEWTDLPPGGEAPTARVRPGMVFADGVLMVIGGQELFDPVVGSQLRLSEDRWQRMVDEGAPQVSKVAHAFWTGTLLFVVSEAEYGLYRLSPD
ncbi:MAG: DUF4215 domain-containing protein [Myxococcales bacterium]|nr:DUF4215 domain-containing protein [Myxococcales bacterium]